MKKILWMITCVLFIAAALSACGSKEFPTGTFTRGDSVHEFRDDGTFSYMSEGEVLSEGTYNIQGDEIEFTDSYCNERYAGPATYKWQYEDGALSFELVGDDLCEDRYLTLSFYWFGPK